MTMHIKRPRIWADPSYPGIIRIHLEGTDGGTPPLPAHFEGVIDVIGGGADLAELIRGQLLEADDEATRLAESACSNAIDGHDRAMDEARDQEPAA